MNYGMASANRGHVERLARRLLAAPLDVVGS
jgi:hypothetical protein